ncbi:MAG TPA: MFS transporter [Chloroflexota bacterium]|nr:MFS transporter [Chloroflexota bacterium]
MFAPFRIPAFRIVWASSLAAAGGQWMERVITAWLALGMGGDAVAVGAVLAVRLLPFILFGLVAGTVADRFSRRTVLMAVAGGATALGLALALLFAGGAARFWHLLAIGVLFGVVQVFDMTSRSAFAVDLVGRERASSAIALNAVAQRFFGALGALAGGLVIPTLGVSGGYLVVAALYAAGLALLALVRVPPRRAVASGPPVPFRRALVGTARLILDNRAVRMVAVASLACETFGYSHQAALPTVARDVLLTGPEGLGQLTAASSLGATLAVVALSALPSAVPRPPLLALALFAWGVALAALGTSSLLPLSLALMLAVGACASAVDVLNQTIAQMAVSEDARGRAVGVWVFSIGMNVVGLMQVGAFVALVGAPSTLIGNGVGAALSALLIASLAPAYRWWRVIRAGAT